MSTEDHPARRVASRFLEAVRCGDWGAALNAASVSWVQGIPPEVEDRLYIAGCLRELEFSEYAIVGLCEVRRHPKAARNHIVDVGFTLTVGDHSFAGTARCVRENARGQRSSNGEGRWGVNPMSVLLRLTEVTGA